MEGQNSRDGTPKKIRVKINICDGVEGGSQRYKITKRAMKNRGKCAESTRGRKSGRRKERVEEREVENIKLYIARTCRRRRTERRSERHYQKE